MHCVIRQPLNCDGLSVVTVSPFVKLKKLGESLLYYNYELFQGKATNVGTRMQIVSPYLELLFRDKLLQSNCGIFSGRFHI